MRLSGGARLLRRHLAPHHRALWHLCAWSALEIVPVLGSGLLVARAIDRGFLAGRPAAGFGWLAALAALWLIGTLGTRQVYPWLAATIEPLRDSLLTAIVTASLRRTLAGDAEASGASISQAAEQVQAVRTLLAALLRNTRQLVSGGAAAIAGLTVLSPRLALAVVPFVLVALAVFAVILRVMVARYRAVILRGETVGAIAAPMVEGIRDIVAYAAEPRAEREAGAAIDAQAAALLAFARARALRLPVVTIGVHLPLLAVLALSPWLVARYHLTAGQIAGSAMYLFSGLLPGFQMLVNTASTILVSLAVLLGRLAGVCAEVPAPRAGPPGVCPAGYDVEIEHLTFAYSPHAEPVIRDLTLTIPQGLHLAVVGPSGAGKSTLANLIARLATPQRGQLRVGGAALPGISEPWLRRTVALIPQEAYVFAGSMRDNLTYLRPEATGSDIDQAVTAVGLADTISRAGGIDAEIPPGGGALSQGERQLIALARVYLSPAELVILDEATCHLDAVAEARAEQAFAERHGTLVVIAHRISSVQRAQQILLMDGAVPLLGTHAELLGLSPLYAELVGHWNVLLPQ